MTPWSQEPWRIVSQMIQKQRMPHALLIQGGVGIGKQQFADDLAAALLCNSPLADQQACGECRGCKLLQAGTHPDFSRIMPTGSEKSTSDNPVKNIRIDDIRDLCAKLNTTSQLEGSRVVVIEQAERILLAAANALLKTLEEPGADTVILLVCSKPHRLPITIRSRCQKLNFSIPTSSESIEWLQKQGVEQAEMALRYAHGAPLLALQCAHDQIDQRQLLCSALLASVRGESSLKYAADLAKIPKDSTLSWLLDWTSDLLKLKCGAQTAQLVNENQREALSKIATKADSKRCFQFYDQIGEYIKKDVITLNQQLVWENLLISWDKL